MSHHNDKIEDTFRLEDGKQEKHEMIERSSLSPILAPLSAEEFARADKKVSTLVNSSG